jgi:hypothetical protein
VSHEQDLANIVRTIIDSIVNMVLGTSDETGRPWVSPVYFSSEKYKEFFWMSSRMHIPVTLLCIHRSVLRSLIRGFGWDGSGCVYVVCRGLKDVDLTWHRDLQ